MSVYIVTRMELAFKKWYMKREKLTDNKMFLDRIRSMSDEDRVALWLEFRQGK